MAATWESIYVMFKIVDNINNIYLPTSSLELPICILSSGWVESPECSFVLIPIIWSKMITEYVIL